MEEKKSVSRRQFLVGSTLAGAGAALAGAATIAAAEEGEGQILDLYSGAQSDSGAGEISQHEILTLESKTMTPDKGTWSWDVIPEDIPADQIAETVDTGVLVIGAGLAGCCAAIAAAEEGAQVTLIEKTETDTVCGRGLDIAAFHTRKQQELVEQGLMEEPDYRQAIRRWVQWAQGRIKEDLLWEWSRKSGACFDWLEALVEPKGLSTYVWDGYYKGPDYTEYPVTHAFYLTGTEDQTFNFTFYSDDDTFGNIVLMPCLYEVVKEKGVTFNWSETCVRLLRDGDGPCTGAIVQLRRRHLQAVQRHERGHRLGRLLLQQGNGAVLRAVPELLHRPVLLPAREREHGRAAPAGHVDRRRHAEVRAPRVGHAPGLRRRASPASCTSTARAVATRTRTSTPSPRASPRPSSPPSRPTPSMTRAVSRRSSARLTPASVAACSGASSPRPSATSTASRPSRQCSRARSSRV